MKGRAGMAEERNPRDVFPLVAGMRLHLWGSRGYLFVGDDVYGRSGALGRGLSCVWFARVG